MKFLSDAWKAAVVALIVAAIVFLASPTKDSGSALLNAGVGFVVVICLYGAFRGAPVAARWLAKSTVRFFVYGLRVWGGSARAAAGDDTLWDWLTDQVFVIQHRYAFSVGCIAFDRDASGRVRCLMVRGQFPGFGEEQVVLWPGGRVRGALEDFESEVRQIVQRETGCSVQLIAVSKGLEAAFSEKVYTFDPHTNQSSLENDLLGPPVLLMRQNRAQSHDVPGHVDILFLGKLQENQQVSDRGMWLYPDQMSDYPDKQLWPDTRTCVKRAAQIYNGLTPERTG